MFVVEPPEPNIKSALLRGNLTKCDPHISVNKICNEYSCFKINPFDWLCWCHVEKVG